MFKTKVTFLEGRLLSNQSELQLKKYSKSLIGWKKRPRKSHFCFGHEKRLILSYLTQKDWRVSLRVFLLL